MPGLCALVAPSGTVSEQQFDRMLARMTPFGWFRTFRDIRPGDGVALGSVALEALPSPEPAVSLDRQSVLFLDGEIYEAGIERGRLETAGTPVRGERAADVLLAGWTAERETFLARTHGLFNAVLWDGAARELTVITDRFGMKPIYVASVPGSFIVASEIKAILVDPRVDRSCSEAGFAEFFAFGHFLNDATLFAGIRAVRPATVLVYRASDGRIVETQYSTSAPRPNGATAVEHMRELDDHLTAAVRRRARPGERLGLSLSGGLDARTILGLMPAGLNLSSICIGIEGGIDHRGAAALAALAGVPHHPYVLDNAFLSNFERHLREMVRLTDGHYLDQGIVMTTLPTYRALGIDFLLRGHGGELLHMNKAYSFSLDEAGLRSKDAEFPKWLYTHLTAYMLKGVPLDIFTLDVPALARASLDEALGRTAETGSPVDRVWPLFLNTRLHRETALSMHKFGCFATVRMPYIDNDVVDTLLSMPAQMKLGDGLQTEILRHRMPSFLDVVNSNTGARMGAGRIERELAQFRMRVSAKLGLKGYQPYERLGLWLRRELRPLVESVLLSDEFMGRGLFGPDAVKRVVADHMATRANHTFLLMSLLVFELGQRMLSGPERFADELATRTSEGAMGRAR